jgi:hypothetical protein
MNNKNRDEMSNQPLNRGAQQGGPIGQVGLRTGCVIVSAVSTDRPVPALRLRGHGRLSVIVTKSIAPTIIQTPRASRQAPEVFGTTASAAGQIPRCSRQLARPMKQSKNLSGGMHAQATA